MAKRIYKERDRINARGGGGRVCGRAKRNVSGQLSDRTKPEKCAVIAEDTIRR